MSRYVHSVLYWKMENIVMDTWRERARDRMKATGMTQEQLAEHLDMTTGGAQKWLAGTRQPSLEEINRIAAILDVAPAWLTHGITPDDVLDGLAPAAQATLRRFIRAERRQAAPGPLWDTLNSIADLSLGADPGHGPAGQTADTMPPAPTPVADKVLAAKPITRTQDFANKPANHS